MQASSERVTLPGGIRQGDRLRRVVEVRPLNGADETFLLESCESLLPAARATELLARALVPEFPPSNESGDPLTLVRGLSIGDREALLLHLRRLTIGNDLECMLSCPACLRALELSLHVSDLLLPPDADRSSSGECTIELADRSYFIRYRLPNGADQELAAAVAHHDGERSVSLILERCVLELRVDDQSIPIDHMPQQVVRQFAGIIAEQDPQAELELDVTCAECGHAFSVLFDTTSFFLKELDARVQRLLRDVHALALHYHWSERDILALPAQRRAHYLSLLSESLATRASLRA